MILSDCFELINIAEEYILVPVGENAESFQGVVVINEAAAFLLKNMKQNITVNKLVDLLVEHYNVDHERAYEDVKKMITELQEMGLISD